MNLIFIGDSLMQYNDESTYPQTGWPQTLKDFIKDGIKVLNFAHNGASTKSIQDLGYYSNAINSIEKGDYVFISFGHNDEKVQSPERYTRPFNEYQDNLRKFIDEARERGATPILLTPIYRRHFKDGVIVDGVFGEYPKAMKEVAKEKDVYLIDTTTLVKSFYSKVGDEASKRFVMNFAPGLYENYPEGKEDNTHLRPEGAKLIDTIVLKQLVKDNHYLKTIIKDELINNLNEEQYY